MSATARRPRAADPGPGTLRERAVAALPPEKLLPDGQPTYVSSWIYVFGVLTLASLVVIIGSGMILALKGPAWWHDTGVGHFFNSIHLWAVELFFFFMVIHLWGKYWMSAWRGGRARVWITGAVTFLVAVPCALTGYVSQQNFDAQWISTQAKDAMNSVGVGAFFNLRTSARSQLPRAAAAGRCGRARIAHVLLVRRHGVVPPIGIERLAGATEAQQGGERPQGSTRRPREAPAARRHESRGRAPTLRMTSSRRSCIAVGVIALLALVLTILFSSPDEQPSTIAQWSRSCRSTS